MCDKELRTVRPGACIGHRKNPRLGVFQRRVELVYKAIAGTTGTGTGRVAALYHKVLDDAMENGPIVKTFLRKENEIIDGFGSFFCEQFQNDIAFVCT